MPRQNFKHKHHDIKARRKVDVPAAARVQSIEVGATPRTRVRIPVRRITDFRPAVMRRKEAQPVSFKSRLGRMLGTMMVALAILSTSSVGGTMSFYNDYELVSDNVFTAGLVDFVLTDTPFATGASSTDWAVDVLPHEQSNPFYYYASSSEFIGNQDLCAALTVSATLDGQVMYSGLLSGLLTGTTTVIDTWTFDFDNFEGHPGQSCKFFVDYNSWQIRHGIDQGGYSDTERVMYTIAVTDEAALADTAIVGVTVDAVASTSLPAAASTTTTATTTIVVIEVVESTATTTATTTSATTTSDVATTATTTATTTPAEVTAVSNTATTTGAISTETDIDQPATTTTQATSTDAAQSADDQEVVEEDVEQEEVIEQPQDRQEEEEVVEEEQEQIEQAVPEEPASATIPGSSLSQTDVV